LQPDGVGRASGEKCWIHGTLRRPGPDSLIAGGGAPDPYSNFSFS
jgi:hypothetical protein